MKNVYALLLVAVFISGTLALQGQSQRMVLIEKGTNASCAPCASQTPGFESTLDPVSDKYILLSYQWYYPGYDPMYEHNPVESDYRFSSYYGQNGVPTAMIDGVVPGSSYPGFNGQWYAGALGGFSAQMVEDRYEETSPFTIDIEYTLTPSEISATVTVTCSEAITASNLKLRIAVIEKVINFDSPPGETNMDEFHGVMKKFLPGTSGLDLQNTWNPGDTETFTESWTHQNVYDYEELAVVAFVQNDSGKEVLQAAIADDGVMESNLTNAAKAFNVGAPENLCIGTNSMSPSFTLRNTGNSELTSCQIVATINGAESVFDWSGSLGMAEDETITFSTFDVEVTSESDNVLSMVVQNPNNESNEEPSNTVDTGIDLAPVAAADIYLAIELDYYPQETTWSLASVDGEIIASGGPYPNQAYDVIEQFFELDAGCYVLTIEDSYGDGLNAAQWGQANGSIEMIDIAGNDHIEYNGTYGFSELVYQFEVQSSVSVAENEQGANNLTLFPNPVVNSATLQTILTQSADVTIDVFDLTGKLVFAKDHGTQPAGQFNTQIDLNSLSNGMYLLNFNVGEAREIRKISVNK